MNELAPNDSFIINCQRKASDLERKALVALYRPLLTSDAYSLISVLWELEEETVSLENQYRHVILLNWLGIDLPSIEDARGRLEALGLMQTLRKQVDNRSLFIYELQPPADPMKFFKDDTLSALLLGVIGEKEFYRLSHSFIKAASNHQDFYNVSKKINDYFQLGNNVINKSEAIEKVQNQLEDSNAVIEDEGINHNFDFKLLEQILSTSFVDHESLMNNQHLIMVEQTIYGINEMEMSQFIQAATSYQDNQIDENELKKKIAATFDSPVSGVQAKKAPNLMNVSDEKINYKQINNLTKQEQEVINATYAMAPIDFIRSLKESSGGFLTSAEERVISSLVNTGMIPVSVVNFLIYYLLVDQGNATLNKNLAEAIANSWIKNKVQTPVEALNFVRNRQNERKTKSYSKSKKIVQRETLPDWAKPDNEQSKKATKKTDPNTTKKINEQLKKLRSRGREG